MSRFPNHPQAGAVDVIDALAISKEEFTRRYVNRNRPCLVKNAVRHWPAFHKWQHLDYLKAHSRNSAVVVRSQIVSEVIGWSNPHVKAELTEYANTVYREVPFHQFLDDLSEGDTPLVADSCRFSEGSAIEQMKEDVGGLPFMPQLGKSRHYPPHRSFLYRNSYTDWHFHVVDETFMAQVVGAKEVLLLPPDEASWRALRPVIEEAGYLYDIDTGRFPGTRALRALRTVVEPGMRCTSRSTGGTPCSRWTMNLAPPSRRRSRRPCTSVATSARPSPGGCCGPICFPVLRRWCLARCSILWPIGYWTS
ncbi:cupin-like domain-containing protein [Pseudomonas sp. NA13]